MSNQQASAASEEISPLQIPIPGNTIHGHYSGNTGSNNNLNSGNITNHFAGGNRASKEDEILQCLYEYSPNYESHLGRVQEPAEGTCIWVTEHQKYQEWLAKRESALLWLSADPGCGKSVVAAFLTKHLKIRPDTIVCYFFFKDDSDEQRRPTFALCALLHQLFRQRNTLYRYAEEEFRTKGKRFTEELGTLWEILVGAVAEAGCREVICVVDALDECEEGTLVEFIRRVARLSAQPSNTPLKFLLTSRPYHEIATELGEHTATIRLRGEDEANAISADVSRVIDEGIRKLEAYWKQPRGLGYLRNLLESSADRTFLWVSLVLGILKDSEDASQGRFTDIVSSAPRNLPELYTRILNKSRDPDAARRILHIVVAAARPLTLQEINVAFRITRDVKALEDLGDLSLVSETTVKNMCGLFVRIIDSKVYLVHQTAREFLINGPMPGQGDWQYTLSPDDSNFVLADICISYLSLQDFENDPLAMNPATTRYSRRRQAIKDYVEKYPFFHYAASCWAGHFRDSQDRQKDLFELTKRICQHGSQKFLTWLKVYWETDGESEHRFPNDFTHLMIASWLGQLSVVERLLNEGVDKGARSNTYGTALNVAAIREERPSTEMLVERGVKAVINGKEYNILLTVCLYRGQYVEMRLISGGRSVIEEE